MFPRLAVFSLFVATFLTAAAEQAQKNWVDRTEFDMFQDMTKEEDASKRLEKIQAWREKYPNTQFKQEGLTLTLNAYTQLSKFPEVIATAKDILQIDPLDVTSLYWLASLTPKTNDTSADALSTGEMAASALAMNGDKVFASDRMPPNGNKEQWDKAKADMEVLGYKTLGWIAMQRKQNDKAEETLKKALDKNPNDGEISYWLYTVIRAMGKPDRSSDALFHLARAASLDSAKGGLPDTTRKQIDDFFVKAYNRYHGVDNKGQQDLRQQSLARHMPPEGFKIRTATEIALEKENEFKKNNPQLAYWMTIKKELTAPEGQKFFEEHVKGAALPGKIEGTELTKFKGRLVKHSPAVNPKELVLIMDPSQQVGTEGEVTLKLDMAMRGKADPGTELEFEGLAESFTREPFMLTFEAEKDKVKGWPVQAAPATKKAVTRPGPVRRKK